MSPEHPRARRPAGLVVAAALLAFAGGGATAAYAAEDVVGPPVPDVREAGPDEPGAPDEIGAAPLSLVELRSFRDASLERGDFRSALVPARELVRRLPPDEPEALIDAHHRLGEIHHALGNYEDAAFEFVRAIEISERALGRFDPALSRHYLALGDVQVDAGRYVDAMTTLEYARHLARRNHGLRSAEQIDSLRLQARALERAGDGPAARDRRSEIYELAVHNYGEQSEEVVALLREEANWYRDVGQLSLAGVSLMRMLRIQEARFGEDALELVPVLRDLGDNFRRRYALVGGSPDRVEFFDAEPAVATSHARIDALPRAVALLERNPDADPAEWLRTLVAIGDWKLTFEADPAGAHATYAEAIARFRESHPELVRELFANPVRLAFVPPAGPRMPEDVPFRMGRVTVTFTVGTDGRPRDVKLVEADPVDWLEDALIARLERTGVFRPRFVDGEPVPVPGMRLTHRFPTWED